MACDIYYRAGMTFEYFFSSRHTQTDFVSNGNIYAGKIGGEKK